MFSFDMISVDGIGGYASSRISDWGLEPNQASIGIKICCPFCAFLLIGFSFDGIGGMAHWLHQCFLLDGYQYHVCIVVFSGKAYDIIVPIFAISGEEQLSAGAPQKSGAKNWELNNHRLKPRNINYWVFVARQLKGRAAAIN